MVHQYTSDQKASPLERKYNGMIHELKDPRQIEEIQREGLGPQQANVQPQNIRNSIIENFNPNEGFVRVYNQNAQKEEKERIKREYLQEYDENGKKYARFWNYEGFTKLHDPFGIYKKKGNYEDLAWKVHRDVEDENVYLKVLYYPKISHDDYHNLLESYETEYKTLNNKNRYVTYPVSVVSFIGAWAVCYRYRIRFCGFILLTLGSLIGTKYLLNTLFKNTLAANLNTKAEEIAKKYPEIKYSRTIYTTSKEVAPKTLL